MYRLILLLLLNIFWSACRERDFLNQYDPQTPKTIATTISPPDAGKIKISPVFPGTYKTGETVILVPEPNPNWVFQKWDGDASGNSNPLTLTMDLNKSVVQYL